jgi:hypothetical protein
VLAGASWGTMLAVGAALGGLVAGTLGTTACFVLDAVLLLLAAGLTASTRRPFTDPTAPVRQRRPVRQDVGEAVGYARRDSRVLRAADLQVGPGVRATARCPLFPPAVRRRRLRPQNRSASGSCKAPAASGRCSAGADARRGNDPGPEARRARRLHGRCSAWANSRWAAGRCPTGGGRNCPRGGSGSRCGCLPPTSPRGLRPLCPDPPPIMQQSSPGPARPHALARLRPAAPAPRRLACPARACRASPRAAPLLRRPREPAALFPLRPLPRAFGPRPSGRGAIPRRPPT